MAEYLQVGPQVSMLRSMCSAQLGTFSSTVWVAWPGLGMLARRYVVPGLHRHAGGSGGFVE
jgi:hypothetical protein